MFYVILIETTNNYDKCKSIIKFSNQKTHNGWIYFKNTYNILTSALKTQKEWKWKDWKIYHGTGNQKRTGSYTYIRQNKL